MGAPPSIRGYLLTSRILPGTLAVAVWLLSEPHGEITLTQKCVVLVIAPVPSEVPVAPVMGSLSSPEAPTYH